MEILLFGGPEAVACPHCKGTTLCAHSLLAETDRRDRRLVPRCSRCGDGIARHSALLGELKDSRPPVCSVCGGRGYLVLAAPIPNTITSKGAP